jgi:hypothetical protein
VSSDPHPQSPETSVRPRRRVRFSAPQTPLGWSALVVLLLGTSGAVRAWQDRSILPAEGAALVAPFSLDELPRTVGDWQSEPRFDVAMDEEIRRIAGASSYIQRTYVDRVTGVQLAVMVLFGHAQTVFGHVPEICLPSSGFKDLGVTEDREIAFGDETGRFRSAVYVKADGSRQLREETYHGFLYKGQWIPDASALQKQFRRDPNMFKIQIERQVGASERRGTNDPTEQFLRLFLPEFERAKAGRAAARSALRPTGSSADMARSGIDAGPKSLASSAGRTPRRPSPARRARARAVASRGGRRRPRSRRRRRSAGAARPGEGTRPGRPGRPSAPGRSWAPPRPSRARLCPQTADSGCGAREALLMVSHIRQVAPSRA